MDLEADGGRRRRAAGYKRRRGAGKCVGRSYFLGNKKRWEKRDSRTFTVSYQQGPTRYVYCTHVGNKISGVDFRSVFR